MLTQNTFRPRQEPMRNSEFIYSLLSCPFHSCFPIFMVLLGWGRSSYLHISGERRLLCVCVYVWLVLSLLHHLSFSSVYAEDWIWSSLRLILRTHHRFFFATGTKWNWPGLRPANGRIRVIWLSSQLVSGSSWARLQIGGLKSYCTFGQL